MTSLKHIAISGVRSYAPNADEVVSFNPDCTIIHGHNGSGKTSILESMKWCLSGQFPPNSNSGKTFIADPRVRSGHHQIQAKVEVIVQNENFDYHIRRTMQIQLKTDGSTNTSALSTDPPWVRSVNKTTNEKTTLINNKNRKKAESDDRILDLIGVNKAVLDYVIFCHQETADWPLCEPKLLKERMDQIFSVDKYAKQIEYYQKLIKSRKDASDKEIIKLNHNRSNFQKTAKFRQQIEEAKSDLEKTQQEHEVNQENLNKTKNTFEEIKDKLGEFRELYARRKTVETEDLKGKRPEKNENRAFLNEKIEQLKSNKNQDKLEQVKLELGRTKREKDELDSKLLGLKGELQDIEQTSKVAKNELLTRDNLMMPLLEKYDPEEMVDKSDFPLTIDQVQSFQKSVISAYKFEKKLIFEEVEDKKVVLDELKNKRAGYDANIIQLKRQISEKQVEMQNLTQKQAKLESTLASESEVDYERENLRLDSEQKDLEIDIRDAMENLEKNRFNVENTRKEVGELREQERKFNNWSKVNTERALHEKRRFMLESEISSIQARLSEKLLSFENECEILVLDKFKLKAVAKNEGVYKKMVSEYRALLSTLCSEQDELKLTKTRGQDKLKIHQQTRKKLETEKHKLVNRIEEGGLDVDTDFEAEIGKLETEIDGLKRKLATAGGRKALFEEQIEKLETDSICPTCSKKQTASEKRTVINNLKDLIEEVGSLREGAVKSKEFKLKLYRDLAPLAVKIKELEEKTVECKEGIKLSQTQMGKISQELHPLENKKVELQNFMKVLERSDFGTLFNKLAEVDDVKDICDRSSLNNEDPPKEISGADIVIAEKVLKSQENQLETGRTKVGRSQARLNKLFADKTRLQENSGKAVKSKLELANVNTSQDSAKKALASFSKELGDVKKLLDPVSSEINDHQVEFADLEVKREQNLKSESKIQEWAKKCKICKENDFYGLLKNFDENVGGLKEKISQIGAEKISFDRKLEEFDLEKESLNRAINCVQDEKFVLERKLAWINLGDQIKKLNLNNPKELENTMKKSEVKVAKYSALKEKLADMISSSKQEVKLYKKELEDPQFKNSVETFMESVAKKQVLSQQAKDLTYLRKVILEGISEYHGKKMDQVNVLLNRYWKHIYLGNDICTIFIKCEAVGSGAGAAAGKYNYKVMAKRRVKDNGDERARSNSGKQDTFIEDELRGRCSTGQKAIACIVIRLALSQAFCTNKGACRVFALDEPTTSLDRKTIKSFCHSIFKIIDVFKESGCPIQLLIITHDQDFLREMYKKRRETVNSCIKVHKCGIDGYSKLSKVDMVQIVPGLDNEHSH